jgi:taurine transport system permease protein
MVAAPPLWHDRSRSGAWRMITEGAPAPAPSRPSSPRARRPDRRWRVEPLITAATLAAIVLLWFYVAQHHLVSELFVPAPPNVWLAFTETLVDGYRGHSLLEHLWASLGRVLMAFVGAALVAVPLGLAIGVSSKIAAVFDPLIEFYRPLPPLAYYTLLVLWFGIDNRSKVLLLFLAAFPPLVISAASGVRGVREVWINGARSLGASRWQTFRYVIFPACLPDIFTGLRVAIGFTYTTLVAAEMVAAVDGIGWMVLDASKFLQSDIIFMGILVMGLTGMLLDRVIRIAERRVVPWRGKA